jgi:hypothetical protein
MSETGRATAQKLNERADDIDSAEQVERADACKLSNRQERAHEAEQVHQQRASDVMSWHQFMRASQF